MLTSIVTTIQNDTASASAGESSLVSLLTSDLGSPLPLHVSLSRPVVFTATDKDSFVESLHRNIVDCGVRPYVRYPQIVRPDHMTNGFRFKLKFEGLSWVSNMEKTRWFLVLQIQRPEGDELNKLLTVCNGTVEDYSQPPLYASPRTASQQSPSTKARPKRPEWNKQSFSSRNVDTPDFSSTFHISIGWALEQPNSYMMDFTVATANSTEFESLKIVSARVDNLKAKVGNNVTSISLAPKAVERKSLFGL